MDEIERLEEELVQTEDPVERKLIQQAIREVERELSEEERWREEGYGNGWL